MKKIFFSVFFFLFSLTLFSQTDSIKIKTDSTNSALDLLAEVTETQKDSITLLPQKMIFTQRLLWGQKGLMRNFDTFKLSPEERAKELGIRRTMLSAHQILGFATLAGMVGQGIVGAKLYKNPADHNLKDTHETLAGAVNGMYFATASLALFSPPKMLDERKGYSSIKVHKWLSIIHLTSMIATNILADKAEDPKYKPYHRAAAYTAFGSLAAAMIVIKF